MKSNKGLRYIAYVRKSEERKERQELSHPAQIRKIKEQFPELKIVKWMEPESQSAFKTGRPIFKEMMDMIENGEADAIVAYHPNRLSRNEHDSARLTYDLRGSLKDMKFCTYTFENSPEGVMFLQMTMNQGQYESSKQGVVVKRGMEEKAMGGERPGVVPQGYIKVPTLDSNGQVLTKKDKIVTHTENDPERYEMIEHMWKLLLYKGYTPRQIRREANEKWKFTIRQTKEMGGVPMGLSTIYRIFTNPFYTGYITHNSELYKGNHNAMITLKEFDYAQKLLGRKGKARSSKVNEHPYGSLIVCGECGCQVVVKITTKLIKRTGELKTYVHYFCTRRSLKRPCTQRRYTTIEKLEQDIDTELAKYTIIPEFRDMALKILRRENKVESKGRNSIYKSQQRRRNEIQTQLDELIDMRTRNLLDDDEYKAQRSRLRLQLDGIDQELRGTENRADNWLKLTEEVFEFAADARLRFHNTKDPKVKRSILLGLGVNFVLKDNNLTLTPHDWLIPIESDYPALFREYEKVRTDKSITSTVKEMAFERIFENWRATVLFISTKVQAGYLTI